MARAKRKPPAKPAAFISPHHRGHFCPVIRYPNTKPPPPTIHTPQKPHGPIKRHQPTPEHKKPAAAPNTAGRFISSHHRGHFCCRHPIPEHKAPAADDNTHPTKTSRPGQTAPTDARTQKNPLPLRTPPAGFISPQHRRHFCRRHPIPEHKALAADNTHPTKTSRPGQTAPTDARTQKNPLPLRTPPAAFISPQHRRHFCRRHPIPEHKKPAAAPNTAGRFHFSAPPRSLLPRHPIPEHKAPADDNTHPTKTSRLGQTAPTDTRTQKNPLPLRTPPAVSAFSKKTAALPKCHSSAPTTAGRRTTPPHTT